MSENSTLDITPRFAWNTVKYKRDPLGLDGKVNLSKSDLENIVKTSTSSSDAKLFGYVTGLESFISDNGVNSNPYNVSINPGNVAEGTSVATGLILLINEVSKKKAGKYAALITASISAGFYLGNLFRKKLNHAGRKHTLEITKSKMETSNTSN